MTRKEKLQAKYQEVLGEVPMEFLTIKQLEEALSDAKPQTEMFALKCKGKFWANPTFFQKFGTVTGEVTPEQEIEWEKVSGEFSDITTKVMDYDPIAKRHSEARKAMRKRAGLPEEK